MMEFLTNNSNYVVLTIVLVIWIGLGSLMLNIDKKVNNLELKLKDKQS